MKNNGWWLRCLSVFVSFAFVPVGFCTPPFIASFIPASATPYGAVTINGSNFSATAANNIVYFGAVKATVTNANPFKLMVQLPTGATYGPISETVQGLTAESTYPFLPTLSGASPLNAASLSNSFNLGAGSFPFSVAVGDIDGDGK